VIGALAAVTTTAAAALEVGRVWRRGSAPLPTETDDVIAAAEEAARQSVEVAVAGYRAAPDRENAVFNLLVSFSITWAVVRTGTHVIHRRGRWGPFRNVVVGRRHIHHFVPGIALAFVSGGLALLTKSDELEKWLAVPFGSGVALTLDESALLLELDDVYWSEEGVVSVQITLAAMALLGALAISRRLLRRGEERVLPGPEEPGRAAGAAA
jgi:hypothetical protein